MFCVYVWTRHGAKQVVIQGGYKNYTIGSSTCSMCIKHLKAEVLYAILNTYIKLTHLI